MDFIAQAIAELRADPSVGQASARRLVLAITAAPLNAAAASVGRR